MLQFVDLKFIQQSDILISKMERDMRKLMVLMSVCTLASFDAFATENNDYAGNSEALNGLCANQPVDYRNTWTKSHTILQRFIKNAAESEVHYKKALNIVNKAYLNVDVCDFFGDTLLFTAAKLKDPRILIALLEKHPRNINARNEYGFTVFSFFMRL